jgi:hypothetical protein
VRRAAGAKAPFWIYANVAAEAATHKAYIRAQLQLDANFSVRIACSLPFILCNADGGEKVPIIFDHGRRTRRQVSTDGAPGLEWQYHQRISAASLKVNQ